MQEATVGHAYVVECTCGHDMTVRAPDRETAAARMKQTMDRSGIEKHFKKYHQGEPLPEVDVMHAHIETDIEERAA